MIPDLNWWGRLLGLLAVEAALLVTICALVARVTRRPQIQRVIWQSCLIAVALVWLGELAGLRGQFGRLRAMMEEPRRQLVVTLAEMPAAKPLSSQVAIEFPEEALVVVPPRPALPVWWPGALWLLGLTALLLKAAFARGLLAFRSRSRSSKEALPENSAFRTPHSAFDQSLLTSAATQVVVARLREQLRLGPVCVQVWPQLRGPVAFGVWRPTVALPADFETRFTPKQREAMLAHELAHLAGRDPLWLALADAVCALGWWHPAVWWARRQLRAASEATADEASALVPDGRAALAESLVTFGRELTSPGPARGLGVSGSGLRSELSRRVTALLAGGPGWTRLNALRRWTVRLAGLAGALGLAVAPFSFNQSASALAVLAEATRKAAQLDDASSSPLPSPAGAQPRNPDGNSTTLPPTWNKPVGTNIGFSYSMPAYSEVSYGFFQEPGFSTEPISAVSTNSLFGSKRVYVALRTNQADIKAPATAMTSHGPEGGGTNYTRTLSHEPTTTLTFHGPEWAWPMDFETGVREAATAAGRIKFQRIITRIEGQMVIILNRAQIANANRSTPEETKRAQLQAMQAELDLWAERKARLESYLAATNAPRDGAFIVPASESAQTDLHTRQYRVDPIKFLEGIRHAVKSSGDSNTVQLDIQTYFESRGVNLAAITNRDGSLAGPSGNQPTVWFNNRHGTLFVRATLADLERVERALQELNLPPAPQAAAPTPTVNSPQPQLLTRSFRVDTDKFLARVMQPRVNGSVDSADAMDHIDKLPNRLLTLGGPESANSVAAPGVLPSATLALPLTSYGVTGVARTNLMANIQPAIREFFRVEGVVFPTQEPIPNPVTAVGAVPSITPPQNQPAVFFNDRTGVLFVRATAEDMKKVERALDGLGAAAPVATEKMQLEQLVLKWEREHESVSLQLDKVRQQLAEGKGNASDLEQRVKALTEQEAAIRTQLIDVRQRLERVGRSESGLSSVQLSVSFVEITEGGGDDIGLDWLFGQSATNNPVAQTGSVTNLPGQAQPQPGSRLQVERLVTEGQSATLTQAQFDALLGKLKQRHGVDLLAAPKVTTLSGRQAQVAVSEVRTLVTDVKTTPGSPTNKAAVNYQTENIPVGPVVDILPQSEGDGWRLTVTASLTEFLGYDDPGKAGELKVPNPGGKPMRGTTPLPWLRVRETQATPLAKSGETVVLRGPLVSDTVRFKDKVPVLGDIPLLGRPFRSEGTSTVRKRLYVFVTPVTEPKP